MIHFFDQPVSHIALPERFTYPFNYTPHPLCVLAAEEVKAYISTKKEWLEELTLGKMFGVLIVQTQEEGSSSIGYLAAFSGNLAGKNLHPYFVPPVYDLLQPQGFFKIEEEQISAINVRISALEVNPHYLHLKEKLDRETEQTRLALIQAKEELKTAKKERELRRKSSPALSKEEQDALVRESQYQKAEFKRLERGWKERIKTLEEEVITFETEIEKLKNKDAHQILQMFKDYVLEYIYYNDQDYTRETYLDSDLKLYIEGITYLSDGKIMIECYQEFLRYIHRLIRKATDNPIKDATYLTIV